MSLSSDSPKRIHLIGTGRIEEAVAGGAITPGHLIMLNSSGQVVVHDDADAPAEALFALEDALQGNSIDDAYASGDRVNFVIAQRGDVVYAYLASGDATAIGDSLVSNGDGTLHVPGSGQAGTPIAIALEAVDATDSDAAASRIKVRIL